MDFIDVLRGVAILGILPVNAPAFALPTILIEQPGYPPDGGTAALAAYGVTHALFKYKFITLFSFLFGVGAAILHDRVTARDERYAPLMGRRLGALWVFGILHATLLWWGDIVSYYAPVGLALCWAATWRPRTLAWVGAVLIALPGLGAGLIGLLVMAVGGDTAFGSMGAMHPDGIGGEGVTGSWPEFWSALTSADPDFDLAVYAHGSYLRVTATRTLTWMYLGIAGFIYFVPRISGLFLLGMACVKARWFLHPESEEGRKRFRLLLLAGLPFGALLTAGSTAIVLSQDGPSALGAMSEFLNYTGSLCLAAAYLAVVALACARWPNSLLSRPFAAVGRTAFTNYIGQSIVMTTIFYSQGFGLFGQASRAELWALVGLLWLVSLTVSPLWLRLFRMGPIEWLWRSITYWRLQPLVRGE